MNAPVPESTPAPSVRAQLAALSVIAPLALALRLYGLGSESIWLDEATSIFLARLSIPDLIRWTAVDIHPPLYYIKLHFWLALGDGEAQVRLLSVLCGLVSVVALYALAQRLLGQRAAFAAALLLAVSPLHVWYSQETRMYAMLAMWGLLSTYYMVRALWDDSPWAWPAYALCAAASMYTHYYTVFILLFQNVAAAYVIGRRDRPVPPARRWLATQVFVAIAFLPWLPVMLDQVSSGGGGWVARAGVPGIGALASVAANFTLGPDIQLYAPLLRRLTYALFAVLVIAGSASPLLRTSPVSPASASVILSMLYLGLPIGAAWLISQVKPLYSLRYLLPFLPPYYILIGQGLEVARQIVPQRARGIVWAGLLGLLVASGLWGVAASANTEQVADWRSIARHVVTGAQAGDLVLFVPGWNDKPFDYYARGRVDVQGRTPLPIDPDAIPELIAENTRGRTRLWLVQAEGHYADPGGAVGAYLDGEFALQERQRFRGNIIVSLYQKQP